MSDIAQRLRTAREQAGLSQGQVAKMLGLHRPIISEIEAGRRKISAEELSKIADIYEVSINWISSTQEDNKIADRVKLAARDLSKLKEEDLDKILRLLSSIKKSSKGQ